MKEQLTNEIRDKVAEILEAEAGEIGLDDNLVTDLEADSISQFELIAELEERYGVVIEPVHFTRLLTIRSTVEVIQELLAEKGD